MLTQVSFHTISGENIHTLPTGLIFLQKSEAILGHRGQASRKEGGSTYTGEITPVTHLMTHWLLAIYRAPHSSIYNYIVV